MCQNHALGVLGIANPIVEQVPVQPVSPAIGKTLGSHLNIQHMKVDSLVFCWLDSVDGEAIAAGTEIRRRRQKLKRNC